MPRLNRLNSPMKSVHVAGSESQPEKPSGERIMRAVRHLETRWIYHCLHRDLASRHDIFSLVTGWMPMSSSNFSQTTYNVGNPLSLHASEATYLPESWQHIRVLSIRGIKDIFEIHGFKAERIWGAGYYPLPSFFARLDPVHAAFLSCKFRKPI